MDFGWPEIGHVFISPYHNRFSMDFNFFLKCMLMKNLKLFLFIYEFLKFINLDI